VQERARHENCSSWAKEAGCVFYALVDSKRQWIAAENFRAKKLPRLGRSALASMGKYLYFEVFISCI